MNIEFKNWLNIDSKDPDRKICTCSGSAFVDVLRPVVLDDGSVELEKDGETCLYDEIQSYKDSCDIHRILQRYANGDVNALNARAVQFFDATAFPTTYAEMLNVVINGEQIFEGLNPDTKQKFGNDFHKFIAMFGQPAWFENMGVSTSVEKPVEKVESEANNE